MPPVRRAKRSRKPDVSTPAKRPVGRHGILQSPAPTARHLDPMDALLALSKRDTDDLIRVRRALGDRNLLLILAWNLRLDVVPRACAPCKASSRIHGLFADKATSAPAGRKAA